jgi:hypothetical protein
MEARRLALESGEPGTYCTTRTPLKNKAVSGIRDILVRIRIRTSDFWIQLRIRLLSSVILRMQKMYFFHNLPTGTSSSVKKFLFFDTILSKNVILKALFQSAQHINEKREGSGSGTSDQWIRMAQKTCGSGSGSRSQHWNKGYGQCCEARAEEPKLRIAAPASASFYLPQFYRKKTWCLKKYL